MAELNQFYSICQKDGFPKIRINGELQCVVEYIDERIGQKKIVNVIEDDGICYYVFENGYQFPLLCYCCGEPLVVKDLAQLKQNMKGRRLYQ